jgi:hypothetical protein
MRGAFVKGVAVGAATSTVVLMAATAFAGTGIGAPFNLGKTNAVNATSTLTGSTGGGMLEVRNNGSGVGIRIRVAPGTAPLAVSSTARVPNLNADTVDGVDASGFVRVGAAAGGDLKGSYPKPRLKPPEAFHEVNAPGEPVFVAPWGNHDSGAAPASFFVDPFGEVHLKGSMQCPVPQQCSPGPSQVAFTLPPGARPPENETFAVDSNLHFGEVEVKSTGAVVVQAGDVLAYVSLDGIAFRAA